MDVVKSARISNPNDTHAVMQELRRQALMI